MKKVNSLQKLKKNGTKIKKVNEAKINESITNITPGSNRANSLVVQMDLAKLQKATIAEIWNDFSVDLNSLSKSDLEKLYNILNPDLSFEEWMEINEF